MKINTSAGPIEIITPNELKNYVPISSTNGTVVQFNQAADSTQPVFAASISNAVTLPTYKREISFLKTYSNINLAILQGLCDQVADKIVNLDGNFFEAVQDSAVIVMENWDMPNCCVVINSNTFLIGEFESSSLQFKDDGCSHGALIVYNPFKFVLVRTSKDIPIEFHHGINKFDGYLSRPLVLNMLKRLELN